MLNIKKAFSTHSLFIHRTKKIVAASSNASGLSKMASDTDSRECLPCPPGTVTVDPFAMDANACRPCGPGLISKNGVQCTTDCFVKLGEYTYDLRPLKG